VAFGKIELLDVAGKQRLVRLWRANPRKLCEPVWIVGDQVDEAPGHLIAEFRRFPSGYGTPVPKTRFEGPVEMRCNVVGKSFDAHLFTSSGLKKLLDQII